VTAVAAIVVAGLLCRSPGVGLPWPIAKWSGSVLWGAMVYALTGVARPGAPAGIRLTAALALALAVELSRLWSLPWLDEFRRTTAGALLLGRIFSPLNLLAYAIGIMIGRIVEGWWLNRHARW
jgi:hypothetical protein